MVVIDKELLIIILLKVQANDDGHISFPPSSTPIQLPHFFEFDKVQTKGLFGLLNRPR
jgi:hypothetical protein